MRAETAKTRRTAPPQTPTNLPADATKDIAGALNALLADVFALYLKTKNFHWHTTGPHFRDYHLLLDEQAGQIYGITDDIAERVRKIGGSTLRSIGQIGRLQRILDNDADYVTPSDMLAELRNDNIQLTASMRERTSCATSMATWRARACSRTGSTTRGDAPGSCSRPAPAANRAADFCRTTCRRPLDAAAMADGSSVMASVARGALLSLSSPRPG
jgi:starvation-inducible DNA-binding protein